MSDEPAIADHRSDAPARAAAEAGSQAEGLTRSGPVRAGPMHAILRNDPFGLRSAVGNRRFSQIVAREVARGEGEAKAAGSGSNGQSVPHHATAALRTLGSAAGSVRIHAGAGASDVLAARPGALAATHHDSIYLAPGAPSLDSDAGRLLLAHEAAHVVQQSVARSHSIDHQPEPADDDGSAEAEADEVAVAATLGRDLPSLSAASGPQYFEAAKHQASLTGAMAGVGFTDEEQEAAYFGNWCRDLSQAFVPMAASTIGTTAAFELVNLLAMHHFGHGVTPAQLGAYDPRQHIDNPAGQTDRDVLGAGADVGSVPSTGGALGHAGMDPRTADELSPAHIAESFAVDSAGIPAYIARSKEYIRTEAAAALAAGRTPDGLFHVGNFSHTCEDLFAHSNWIEIGIGRLIQEGQVTLPPGDTHDEVEQRLAEHRPPIENFAADVADRAGRARPILSTGTFSGGNAGNDTLISIRSEAQNLLADREPFKEDGSGGGEMFDFALEVLKNAQASATEGSIGYLMTEVIEQAVTNIGSAGLGIVDSLPGAAGEQVPGRFGSLIGGATSLLSGAAHGAADFVASEWQATFHTRVAGIINQIAPTALTVEKGLLWIKSGAGAISDAWTSLKDAVNELPDAIARLLIPKLVQAEREFKRRLRSLGNTAYAAAVQALVDAVEGLAPVTDTAETNVGEKLEHWQAEFEELRETMQRVLREVGGAEGIALAEQVGTMDERAAIGFAQSAEFNAVLAGLVGNAAARARLTAAATGLDDMGNSVTQLNEVPEWARAGASHSQIAKDHDDSAFFGIAFTVARDADSTLMRLMRDAWGEAGDTGPAPGMGGSFGTLDATGELPEEAGVSDMERARRQAFLETRGEGDAVIEFGTGGNADIGPRLVALADGLEALVLSYPGVDFALRPLIAALTIDPDRAELLATLQMTRDDWEDYASSGELDEDLMRSVDSGLAAVSRAVGLLAHGDGHEGHDHDAHDEAHDGADHAGGTGVDLHHPREAEGHDHGDRTEVFFHQQIDELDRFRAGSRADERIPGRRAAVTVDGDLNEAVAVSGAREGEHRSEEAADRITAPRERLFAEIDRIFGHPYDSNWWVPTVAAWCRAHPDILERSVRDRNHGVAHSHTH